jgi:hypothetical protein
VQKQTVIVRWIGLRRPTNVYANLTHTT